MKATEVVARLEGAKPNAHGWEALCPSHEDTTPSLSVSEGADGRVLLKCHAGCSTERVVAALGFELKDLFADSAAPTKDIVATYDYRDETGTLLSQVVRFVPKDFRQRRPDGQGGWHWNANGIRRVLYRLPELLGRSQDATVWIAEGEKDADALAAHGLAATTNAGGARKWRSEYTAALRDADVIIIPDNDEPGRLHAEDVARQLQGTAARVRVLTLPRGKDATDFFSTDGTVAELTALAEAAPDWTPAAATVPPRTATDAEDAGPSAFTDTDNAARLIDLHGNRLHYIAKWAKWLVWILAQGRWSLDDRDVRVRELAKDVGRSLKEAAAQEQDRAAAKKMFAFALKSLDTHGISGMVDLARGIDGIPLEHEALDRDGWVLGVRNGVVDLRTGTLRPADPTDLMTMQAPVHYDEQAQAPRWEQACTEWFPDETVRAYVQRVAGSALVGAQLDHVFIIHYGGGRNGKGTFVRAIQRVLGPYAVVIHLSLLVEQRFAQHDTVKAELFRTRLAIASETQRRVKVDEASVKNLTGGDRITARRMREDPWEFDPSHSLWLQTNHLPEISGRDTGIWSRIRVVKWVTTFSEQEQDRTLDATLATEAPGILRWLVRGCLKRQRDGLAEPEAVIRETLAYRQAEDVLAHFCVDTGLMFDPNAKIQASVLQNLLTEWAHAEGIDPPRQDLSAWLKDHGAKQRQPREKGPDGTQRRVRYWERIGLSSADDNDAETAP